MLCRLHLTICILIYIHTYLLIYGISRITTVPEAADRIGPGVQTRGATRAAGLQRYHHQQDIGVHQSVLLPAESRRQQEYRQPYRRMITLLKPKFF